MKQHFLFQVSMVLMLFANSIQAGASERLAKVIDVVKVCRQHSASMPKAAKQPKQDPRVERVNQMYAQASAARQQANRHAQERDSLRATLSLRQMRLKFAEELKMLEEER